MLKLKMMKILLIVEIIKYNIETNSNKNGFYSVEYYNNDNNNENDENDENG
nr:MAG: hypothetical protein [Bacteriophage sp.]